VRRQRKKVIALLGAVFLSSATLVAGAPTRLIKAAGNNSSTASESIVIEGSVNNSTIQNTVNNQDPTVLASMVKTFADQMAATTEALNQAEARATALATKLGFSSAAVGEFFRILGEQNVSEEKIPLRLVEIATHFAQTRDELAALEPDDPHAADLLHLAQIALEGGRLTEADALVGQAKEAEFAAIRQASEVEQKAREAKDRHSLNAARLAAGQGSIAMTQLRCGVALASFKQATSLVPPGYPDKTADYVQLQADALLMLAKRESGSARLEEAVAAYREALRGRTSERVPEKWAVTQNNLGNALWDLSDREAGTARLEEAMVAYREALKVFTPERTRLKWAEAQNNLGNALLRLGQRGKTGTIQLEEAMVAYREALKVLTHERAPLQWAGILSNLGNVLMVLGQQEEGTVHLKEAVATYRDALTEETPSRVPLEWGMTQTNLGGALGILGEREEGTVHLTEAVTAFRDGLKEMTRDRLPFNWAQTQIIFGNVLMVLGEREEGTVHLKEAMTAYDAALSVLLQSGAENVEIVQKNRERVKALLGKRGE